MTQMFSARCNMASNQDLYVSIQPDPYRYSKSNVLSSQADLLTTLKHLHNLKVLSRQKRDLKIILRRHLSTVISLMDSISDKMPEVKTPKTKVEKYGVTEMKIKTDYAKRDEIDKELMNIQEKLRQLNG